MSVHFALKKNFGVRAITCSVFTLETAMEAQGAAAAVAAAAEEAAVEYRGRSCIKGNMVLVKRQIRTEGK